MAKTIKLTNSVLVDSSSLKIGVDSSNLLATITSSTVASGWTATQDCWFFARPVTANSTTDILIDGVTVNTQSSPNATVYTILPIFIHKGQVVKVAGHGTGDCKIFGTK